MIYALSIPDVKLIKCRVYSDKRGLFSELYKDPFHTELGLALPFVQDNYSLSLEGVIRGMHFQSFPGQAKLISVLEGEIYDVFVDIRIDSPHFGQWGAYILKEENFEQIFIPEGFAHGFAVLSKSAKIIYKVSSLFDPEKERRFRYDDPSLGIKWPVEKPLLSDQDRSALTFEEVIDNENLDSRSGRTTR